MKLLIALVLAGLFAALAACPGSASLQPQMYCWGGDSEFPVACEEEGDDGAREQTKSWRSGRGWMDPRDKPDKPEDDNAGTVR
jgi:hypothetical protein